MKKKAPFLLCILLVLLLECIMLIFFAVKNPDFSQDTLAVNEILQTVQNDWEHMENHFNQTELDYVVIDLKETLLFKTTDGLSESLNSAISHRDTILDVRYNGVIVGKIIIFNNGEDFFVSQKLTVIVVLIVAILVQILLCVGYLLYLQYVIVKPFSNLKGFAERIAGGDLDVPLEMDRHNMFGAFTESFDIMRSELKRARIAEAKADASKKELVAKLSHDIKTPIASIKAASEVGYALSENERMKENYTQIIRKADHINSLITNLFTATLEELQQLTVTPTDMASGEIKDLLINSDYLNRAVIPDIPECFVIADRLRLQQVFDNLFANSYKYANTKIDIKAEKERNSLKILIQDFGGGVAAEDLPRLKEKFKRGNNAVGIEGAGLGLYISDYFMVQMKGELYLENSSHGLVATVLIRLSGTI